MRTSSPSKRRNPVAKALRVVRPKVVRSRVKYTRKPKHKDSAL